MKNYYNENKSQSLILTLCMIIFLLSPSVLFEMCIRDRAITFEFSHFMSPQSAYLQAGHLYDRYKEYFEIK